MYSPIIGYEENRVILTEMLLSIYKESELTDKMIADRVQRFGFEPDTNKILSVDGIIGAKSKAAFYINPLLLKEAPNLRVALNEILNGSQEIGGSNMGPFVRKYFRLKKDPVKNAGPFCAGGASFCLDEGYPDEDTPYILGAIRLGKAVADKGILKDKPLKERRLTVDKLKPGDLVIYERITDTPGTGHVGTHVILIDDLNVTVDFNVGRYPAPTRIFIQEKKNGYAQGSEKFLFGARWK